MSMLVCFFLVLIPYTTSITFNFTTITPKDSRDIIFLGDAAYSRNDGIMLTHGRNGDQDGSLSLVGRATYNKLLHLWDGDGDSNNLASFTTSFTFVIDSYPHNNQTDGLTFFLAQNNSMIKTGGYMGLPTDSPIQTTSHRFVAVEFDTFGGDEWDPKDPNTNISIDDHVGIDIDSIISVGSRKWFRNMTYGNECKAMIEYDSDSKILSVSFTNFENNSLIWESGLDYPVDLRHVLPEWVIFGFSASTRNLFEKIKVVSWTFNSTESNVDENNGEKNMLRNMGLIVGTFVIVTSLGILAYFLRSRKKNYGDGGEELGLLDMNNEFEMGDTMPRRFSYGQLAMSTNDFAEIEKLGEGGFGGVYKGFLKDSSMYVAVKKVSKTSKQGIKEYASEVRIISRLRHKNLVQLIGWCHEKGQLLVYEFMENGSLDLHLFKGKSLLAWHTRYKIARGLASALLYLHEECDQCVLHRDIKSSNVILDSSFNAKLGDFGLAKLVDHEKGSQTTMLAGTLGYMAPEYMATRRATKESDVFSFGVVALEIACGREAIDNKVQEEQILLSAWVWELYGNETLLEAVDMCLGLEFEEEEEMRRLLMVGLWCVHPDSKLRPSIRQAIKVLNFEAPMPKLPLKMPVACYFTPPKSSLSEFTSINELWRVVGIKAGVIEVPM